MEFVFRIAFHLPAVAVEELAEVSLTGVVESADYIHITTDAMSKFGICVNTSSDGRSYTVHPGGYTSPKRISVEGDWSNAALWLAAGAVGTAPVTVTGLDMNSPQGDRRIVDVLRQFGAAVTVDGDSVNLTPTEYAILHLLMENPGKVYSTKAIYEAVWDEPSFGNEGVVAVHIRHLREKIEINPAEPRYIKVVWGKGYKMEAQGGRI